MKPGNLRKTSVFPVRCQIRRQTTDEDSIDTHIESDVRFFHFTKG